MGQVRYKRLAARDRPGVRPSGPEPLELEPDGAAPLEAIQQMVMRGELRLTDFVDLGRGWQTVVAAEELGEVVDRWRSLMATHSLLRAFISVTILGILAAGYALYWNLAH